MSWRTAAQIRESLTRQGCRLICRSRKFDGACLMRSELWAFRSGTLRHVIEYEGGVGRLLPSSRRVKPLPRPARVPRRTSQSSPLS